ncbi:MAG: DUF4143 domain-containing protein [Propionibacteriaceae bacterium]|nr:DUF4143 domain-containing protein [Propionibacteriaceae bacterium]
MDTVSTLGHAYKPRLIDPLLDESLGFAGAVLLEGPRGCGKTMTAMHAASSYALLDDPGTARIGEISPEAILAGARPRLLDEWQLMPQLWNLMRRIVDSATSKGQFILTGSAMPADDTTRHTGAARVLRIRQHTLTWCEKTGCANKPGVSLAALFTGQVPTADLSDPMTYAAVISELIRPGFPALTELQPDQALIMLQAYIEEVSRADVPRLINQRHDPIVLQQLMRALARSTASPVSYATLASDMRQVAPSIKPDTVADYMSVLERLFILERQSAWTPLLRSRARLRTSAKLHLADPALAAAALGATATSLFDDPNTVGLLFESAVIHDLRVLATSLRADIRHFRDSNGHEIDAVISLPDGRWAAVEVKLGGGQAIAAAASLTKAIEQLDVAVPPVFKLVVTGTGQTFTMADGTITCPLAVLRP